MQLYRLQDKLAQKIQRTAFLPSISFLPLPLLLLLFFSIPLLHVQHLPVNWRIIPIFLPSAGESNLISLRSTPANSALTVSSHLQVSCVSLQLFDSEWNSRVILKSSPESNLIFLTTSHSNVYLKRSYAVISSLVIRSSPSLTHLWIHVNGESESKGGILRIMCQKTIFRKILFFFTKYWYITFRLFSSYHFAG